MRFTHTAIALATMSIFGFAGSVSAQIPDVPLRDQVENGYFIDQDNTYGPSSLDEGKYGIIYAATDATNATTSTLLYAQSGNNAVNNGSIWVIGGGEWGTRAEGMGGPYSSDSAGYVSTVTNNGAIYVLSDGKTTIKGMGSNPGVKTVNNGNIVVQGGGYGMVVNSGNGVHSVVNSAQGTITAMDGGTGMYIGHLLQGGNVEMRNEGTILATGENSTGVKLEIGQDLVFENTGTIAASEGANAVDVGAGSFTLALSGDSNIDGNVNISSFSSTSITADGINDNFSLSAAALDSLKLSNSAQLTLNGDEENGTTVREVNIEEGSSLGFSGNRTVTIASSTDNSVDGTFVNDGTFSASALVIDNSAQSFVNNGTIDVQTLDISGNSNSKGEIGGTIKASERITYHGIAGNLPSKELTGTLETPLLQIKSDYTDWSGIRVSDSSVLANVQNIELDSTGGKRISFYINGDVDIVSNVALVGDNESQIEVEEGSNASFGNIVSNAGKGKFQVNGSAEVAVDNITVEGDTLNLQVNGTTAGEGAVYNLNRITVADGATLKTSVYEESQPEITIQGDLNINLGKEATVDFGGMSAQDQRDDKIHIASENITVNVSDSDNHGNVYLSESGTNLDATSITVSADGSNNTGNASGDLEKLVDVVQLTNKTGYTDEDSTATKAADGAVVSVGASDIFDAASGTIVTDEAGMASVQNVQTERNVNVYGISEMAVIGLDIWRSQINDMNKRLGELRDSSAYSNGLWTRVYQNKSSYGSMSVESKHSTVQVGYDRQLLTTADSRGWLGAAFSYTDISSEFDAGDGDGKLYSLTVYGSWLHDNGAFVDLTAKFGRIENEFTTRQGAISSAGDYDANAYSVSAEAGWRFYPVENLLFVEPQVEVMYGYVDSADYTTSTRFKVEQDSTQSLIGRVGFAAGFKYPDNIGNVYVRASVLHDFCGDVDYSFTSASGGLRKLSEDLGGTWVEYGVGANFNFTDQMHGYVDLERQSGGEIQEDWRWNLGVRYSF